MYITYMWFVDDDDGLMLHHTSASEKHSSQCNKRQISSLSATKSQSVMLSMSDMSDWYAVYMWLFVCFVLYVRHIVLYCTIGGDHSSRGQYDSLWSALRPDQINSTHCTAPLMYASMCFIWVMCYSWCYSDNKCMSLLGEPWAVCFYSTQPGSQFLLAYIRLCAHTPWQLRATHSLPDFLGGHSRFWCYRDRRGAYGLTQSIIWRPILITVSGTLIPERNGLSQFIEDTGKPSVPVQEFNLIACPLA